MKNLVTGAALFAFGVGVMPNASAASLSLRGSDALEDVIRDVIAACPAAAAAGPIAYIGGGSAGGEAAMTSLIPTQQIAPMSRQLAPTFCDATRGPQQLLIGLDGVVVVGANQPKNSSLDGFCTDAIVGDQALTVPQVIVTLADGTAKKKTCGSAEGCDTPGTYVFTDWRDVLALLYAGQNHTGASAVVYENPVAPDPRYNPAVPHLVRNPARIDCSSAARVALANNWGTLFSDNGGPDSCRTASCIKLKHAFRLGDLSGTTDTFVSLVGLAIAVPPFTKTLSPTSTVFPGIDSAATANPFCNAGEAPMNKGDSDYLDLDPIRRIADSDTAATGRLGLEQVAEGYNVPSNIPTVRGTDNRAEPAVAILADAAWSNFQNLGVDNSVAGGIPAWITAQAAKLSTRKGLGLVLPIEIPSNYGDEATAYWGAGTPVKCAPGVLVPTLLGNNVMCPDGSGPNLCLVPVDATGQNFNCVTESPLPAPLPIRDSRVYNLLVLTNGGKFLKDGYLNPNLSLNATRQNRVVSAYFRLHTSRLTDLGGTPTLSPYNPGVSACKQLTSTNQIGCLVRANPCSVGFAGREAVDLANQTLAYQIGMAGSTDPILSKSASQTNIEALTLAPGTQYPLARALWVNAVMGLGSVTDANGERSLLECLGATGATETVDMAIANRHFVVVPPASPRQQICPF